MKLKLMTMVIAIVAFSAIKVKAQQPDESHIKILGTEKPGVIKLVNALPIEDGVTINFITDEGIVTTDEIKGSYPKGVARKYDITMLHKEFWIDVITPRLTVTFHVAPSGDGKTFTTKLEKAVHRYDVVVASRE